MYDELDHGEFVQASELSPEELVRRSLVRIGQERRELDSRTVEIARAAKDLGMGTEPVARLLGMTEYALHRMLMK